MRKMNKSLLFTVLGVMLLFNSFLPSLANSAEPLEELNEFQIKNSNPIDNVEPLSEEVMKKKLKEFQDDFDQNKLPKYKKEDHDKAIKQAERIENILNKAKKSEKKSVSISTTSTQKWYDTNKAKLTGNFIEGLLDLDEGMTETEIYKVGFTHANTARDWALKTYPRDPEQYWVRDAARHFSWNLISSKDSNVGKIKTRTATINHEWGALMITPMVNYYSSKYNEYTKKGKSDYDAATEAFSATILYIPNFKYTGVTASRNSYSFFKALFKPSNIMDLHNNCWGRSYSTTSLSYADAFRKSYQAGELIGSESQVGDTAYKSIWQKEWYTY
jgi:hypothetical protein